MHFCTQYQGYELNDSVLSQLAQMVPTDAEALMVSRFRGDRGTFRMVRLGAG